MKMNNFGVNKINRENDLDGVTDTSDRLKMLERWIKKLESKFSRQKDLFIQEDMKARGLKKN